MVKHPWKGRKYYVVKTWEKHQWNFSLPTSRGEAMRLRNKERKKGLKSAMVKVA